MNDLQAEEDEIYGQIYETQVKPGNFVKCQSDEAQGCQNIL